MKTRTLFSLPLFLSLLIYSLFSCKHEPLQPAVNEACEGSPIEVSGTVTNTGTSTSADGKINAAASGGSDFTYALNNGNFQASGSFTGLTMGTYTVLAKSGSGCIGSAQFIVGTNDPCYKVTISITAIVTNASSPTQNNGSINASATGGTGFQYSLNGGAYQANGLFSNLAAGTYTIHARNSNGCTGTAQFSVATASICNTTTITLSTTISNSDKCTPSGSITATASGSSGFQYQLNGGAFQSSNVFSNLAEGDYILTVKDVNGCTKTAPVSVSAVTAGTLFTNVKSLISNKCRNCHTNGGNNGGVNFDNDCNIIALKERIKARAVDNNPSPMPPGAPMSATDKQKIINWINAGGRYTD